MWSTRPDKEGKSRPPLRLIPAGGRRHPAFLAAVLVAVGVCIGDRFDTSPWTWGLLATAAFAGCVPLLRSRRFHLAAIALTAVVLGAVGALRISIENSGRPTPALAALCAADRPVEVFGRIAGVPYLRSGGWRAPLDLRAVARAGAIVPLRARVLVTAFQVPQGVRYGDYLRVTGYLDFPFVRRNPGGFDYAAHLFRQGIDATLRPAGEITHLPQSGSWWSLHRMVEPVRGWIGRALEAHLPSGARALLAGLLLGDTDRLPREVYDAFRESGTAHLLAVSGANVWLLVGILYWPLRLLRVPRWPGSLLLLAAVIGFSYLTRNEPSVVRAALMVATILIGGLIGRPVHPLNAVGVAALVILLFSPAHLFRPGFQLSFAAVIGIIVALGWVQRSRVWTLGRWARQGMVLITSSAAATLATAPVSAAHFGSVPVMGVFANLVLVPMAWVIGQLAIVFLAFSAVWTAPAAWVATAIDTLTDWSIVVARWFSDLPGSVVVWSGTAWLVAAHVAVAVLLLAGRRRRYQWGRPLAYYIVALFAIVVLRATAMPVAPQPSIVLLDTGRQRVAAVSDDAGEVLWLADDPGIDPDLAQWVVEPCARILYRTGAPSRWLPWHRSEQPGPVTPPGGIPTGSRWRRYSTMLDGTSMARRVWADLFTSWGDTVVHVRDLPDDVGLLLSSLAGDAGRGHTAILPISGRIASLRQAIEQLRPGRVILYGRPARREDHVSRLFWSLRYPDIRFFTTPVHGGIVVDFTSDGVRVSPTLAGAASGGPGSR